MAHPGMQVAKDLNACGEENLSRAPLSYFAISTPPVAPDSVSKNLKTAFEAPLTKELLDVAVDSKLTRSKPSRRYQHYHLQLHLSQ